MSLIVEPQQKALSSQISQCQQEKQQQKEEEFQHLGISQILQQRYSKKSAEINIAEDGASNLSTMSLTTKLSNRQQQKKNRRVHSDNSVSTLTKQMSSWEPQQQHLCSSFSTNESCGNTQTDRVHTLDDENELFENIMNEAEYHQKFNNNEDTHNRKDNQQHQLIKQAISEKDHAQHHNISDAIGQQQQPVNSNKSGYQYKQCLEKQTSMNNSHQVSEEKYQEEHYQQQLFGNKLNCVPHYAFSVIKQLQQQQKSYQISQIHEITELQARERVIDILSMMHYSLKLQNETFFLAGNIIARYLEGQKASEISRPRLAVLAAASLFISAKYEEIYSPSLRHFASALEQNLSTLKSSVPFGQSILDSESTILKNLGFSLFGPTRLQFFEAFLPLTSIDSAQITFCHYLLELSQFNHSFYGQFSECEIASSVILLSEKFKNISGRFFWSDTLEIATKYRQHDLYACVEELYKYLVNVQQDRRVLNVFSKYSLPKYKSVALIDYDLTHNVNNQPSASKKQQSSQYSQQTEQSQDKTTNSSPDKSISTQYRHSSNMDNNQIAQQSQNNHQYHHNHHHSISYQYQAEKEHQSLSSHPIRQRSSLSLTLVPSAVVQDENNHLTINSKHQITKENAKINTLELNKTYDITKYINQNSKSQNSSQKINVI